VGSIEFMITGVGKLLQQCPRAVLVDLVAEGHGA
jgi:hypothetical protein